MIELSLKSGGCIKFDLKAWNENLNIALTGVTNKRTIENFSIAAGRIHERPEPPLLTAVGAYCNTPLHCPRIH